MGSGAGAQGRGLSAFGRTARSVSCTQRTIKMKQPVPSIPTPAAPTACIPPEALVSHQLGQARLFPGGVGDPSHSGIVPVGRSWECISPHCTEG